ncbi:MAG TPA: hypothetical protein VFM18_02670 [Methanosarcina sp.]|nr:hypothetical protein [Methanosarcina sp.]
MNKEEIVKLFREALAWGMVYGPVLSVEQWDEMREEKAEEYAHQIISSEENLTPKSDLLEKTRIDLGQERTPAYGDALALCRKFEKQIQLSTIREPQLTREQWLDIEGLENYLHTTANSFDPFKFKWAASLTALLKELKK